ncbi:MarR family winged helix-turn-helix transcriptional regulator [Alteribacillus iranensis]|uniref:DNA-binding transcriptional regulator, MarR family n=1 Tax=Alteribacillus iranensis TaxID=930128 RepID=A0A1I2BX23_9BACI|nr:MarR family transcriptional regulator [Alteribacillus iranensis]SFE59890.1 DNA-binding transcriptional regulator, MarR family [Alteribacillus iranensis]
MDKKELLRAVDESLFDLSLCVEEEFGAHFHEIPDRYRFVLLMVSRYSTLYVRDVAELLHASRSSVSQLLSKMEAEEYIVRELDPNERRQTFVKLGRAGKAALEAMRETRNRISAKYLRQLSHEDLEDFYRIANNLKTIVKEEQEAYTSHTCEREIEYNN